MGWIENGLSAAYFAAIARYLGPSLYGQWAYGVAAYVLVIGIVGFGIDTLMVLHLGRNKRDAAEFLGLMLTLRLALLGLGAVGLSIYAVTAESDPVTTVVLLMLIPALIARGVALWARVCFLGYERVGEYVKIATLSRGAEAVCGIAYLLSGGGLLGIVVVHVVFWMGEAGFGLRQVRARLTTYTFRFDRRQAADLLRQGAVLGAAAAGYTWLVAGPIMLLRLAGTDMAVVGQFAIVFNVTMILVGSAQAFFTAALPVLSRSAPPSYAGNVYCRLTALTVAAAAIAAAAGAWMLGPPVAEWALGAHYSIAGGLIGPFMLIGGMILAPTGYAQILVLSGRRWPTAVADLAAGLCLAATLPLGSAIWGLNGAVLATAGAWMIRAGILIAWPRPVYALGSRAASGAGEM